MNDHDRLVDAAVAMGIRQLNLAKRRQLYAKVLRIKTVCGSCSYWMTSKCPHERNVNGRNYGPSMNGPICGKFSIDKWSQERIAKLEAEINTLL